MKRRSSLSNWGWLSLLLAGGIAGYGGWLLWSERRWRDLPYLLLGVYLLGLQVPGLLAFLSGQPATCPIGGPSQSLLRLAPAAVLFALALVLG